MRHLAWLCALASFTAGAFLHFKATPQTSGLAIVAGFACAAFAVHLSPRVREYSFPLWVFAAVAASMYYPELFDTWAGVKLTSLISPLIQVIMFGVGTQLSVADFARAVRMPKAVLVGVTLQFSVMPLLGWSLAQGLGFEGEVGAGIILVGSCSAGVASNVMAYIAGANVATSVTITSITTLLAPVMTPLLMKLLAHQYVTISFSAMMLDILWMIITPVVAGLIVNKLLHGRKPWLDRALPVVSMVSICYIITIITASSRDRLLQIGGLLILAAIIHNVSGYLLGYWGARLVGLAEPDCRVVAFEVGMQNGGMGSALAINVLKSADAALAPAIFGPWMNISGSLLASFWRNHRPRSLASGPDTPQTQAKI